MTYSLAQMQGLLRQAGWPENLIVTMAAVGMAESSGNPQAHNTTSPDDSYGLWQINMIGSLGPARRARYGLKSNTDLYNPLLNAKIALDVYAQQGLRAWGPYVTGIYKKYIPQSQAAYSPNATPTPTTRVQFPQSVTSGEPSDYYQDSPIAAAGFNSTTLLMLAAGGLGLWFLLGRS
jgi:Transglycosylase SLT domain.